MNFSEDLSRLENGELSHWIEDHYGCLAYIILCDQFYRLINRKTKHAFNMDSNTRQVMLSMLTENR